MSDLIKRLGGYDKAKESYEWLESCRWHRTPMKKMDELKQDLLEYRREHGIYDKGDKVVYVDDFMHDEISVISNIDDRVWLNDDAAVCIKDMVRHATPQEIKAGHRL